MQTTKIRNIKYYIQIRQNNLFHDGDKVIIGRNTSLYRKILTVNYW